MDQERVMRCPPDTDPCEECQGWGWFEANPPSNRIFDCPSCCGTGED